VNAARCTDGKAHVFDYEILRSLDVPLDRLKCRYCGQTAEQVFDELAARVEAFPEAVERDCGV